MNWDYLQPVKIHFGKGRVKEIKEIARELGCERGLLVAGPFFFKSGLAEKVIKESEGMIVASFGDVSPNPDVVEVDACAEVIRQKNIGFVVALGGGSPMDCAKAAASVALTSDSIRKYHGTGVAMPEKHLPLIAVPTTAGTGSEVTCVSVLSDHANGKKAEGYSRYDENISKPVELAPYGLGIQMEQMHTDLNQPLIRINS